VPVGTLREAVTGFGATDAEAVAALCGVGRGWCQGRFCGYAAAALTADLGGRPIEAADLVTFAHRPLAQPVRLGDLAEPDSAA
jgi:hypothetical protein